MSFFRITDAILKRDLWKTVKSGARIETETVKQQVARATAAKMTIAEARLLELLIHDHELREIILPQLEETDYETLSTVSVFRAVLELHKTGAEITLESLLSLVESDETASDFVPVLMMSEPPREQGEVIDEVLQAAESCVFTLRSMAISNRILDISQELIAAEQSGNTELLNHLVLEQIELARLKRDLQSRI
jgi:hypothetical protein